ncbi:MAG: 30S ribosomal protein S10 [Euryarchaeota archaeon]|jgi:small subunit ribosomal protein S10|nr:30S ribosomal protein S10 [Euryarchaeota archaeon]MBM73360.1 30S ribosomal protein S10 [Euryarchaeota archaeon]MDP6233017.1 30S ribosomal protein S10 [Candidatus Poseidoniaceae archaeon]DAC34943.1 MAG TPA: 30S ribosomal protein S10 [Candidatus Poseidoniales archaeon]|tara:strand:- start:3999 stop:4328 length:330 start_codon:yes stop_codon:yes gene_type:complete
MAAVTVIKLTGENHQDIDQVAHQIKLICDSGGVKLRGPIPLPTRRLVVPVRRAPDGEGSETYDHYEMRVHKRLLEMDITSGKDESALRNVARIDIPDTVSIEISMRSVN